MPEEKKSLSENSVKGKTVDYLIIIFGIIAFALILFCSSHDEDLDLNSLSKSNLSLLRYNINIDCRYVSEHAEDESFWFHESVVELCKYAFPDLNYTMIGEKRK